MIRTWHTFFFAVFALAVLFPSGAAAQQPASPGATGTKDATELHRLGGEAYKAGRFEDAYKLFSEAFALRKGYDIAGHLAQTELRLGKNAAAAEHLAYSLTIFPATGRPEARAKHEELLAVARSKIGTIRPKVSEPGAELLVDGIPVKPSTEEVFLEPGPHSIDARKDGFESKPQQVQITPGSSADVVLTLTKKTSDDDGSGSGFPDHPPSDPKPIWPTVVLASVSAVGVGVGIAGFVLAAESRSDAEDLASTSPGRCGSDGSACADISEKLDDEDSFRAMARCRMA